MAKAVEFLESVKPEEDVNESAKNVSKMIKDLDSMIKDAKSDLKGSSKGDVVNALAVAKKDLVKVRDGLKK